MTTIKMKTQEYFKNRDRDNRDRNIVAQPKNNELPIS